ncbi:hypothetical protein CAXC1_50003 [Candidatus Xenohaliotis californiensis]|uniref:Uncharacterized protein n=1 Tax=Candidatus Xenohaliotis californiensis TaxID=84677 RepID=A0ABM9N954_9RICK|nr:hypothetical protein CAXC1_50003 [Candidatus Xenohaliotis californiensis]
MIELLKELSKNALRETDDTNHKGDLCLYNLLGSGNLQKNIQTFEVVYKHLEP